MIFKVTSDESGYHAHVEGKGIDIMRGLETLIEGLLRNGAIPEYLLDKIVANAKDSAREVYRDTDSIKLSDVERGECMDLIDGIFDILKRAKRRRDDD